MLSSRNRMRRSADFGRVMRRGRRAGRDALGVVLLLPRPDDPDADARPRVGFTVSKAVGSAVVRNRVQRRLRHLMRDRIADLPAGSLLVVRAKPLAAHVGYDTLAERLDAALAAVRRPKSGATRRRKGRGGGDAARADGDQRAGS
ncbi:ribonuclease P protein component [Nocardiopsis baichengensis]|uniref:ribonuclease P protein component n=1 Tax=Nocardiopsis baichengensis TaxID=280240 RepID=UPI000344B95A|nr:ribonuclease P protein component [Nocardiopsis baichengensis]